MKRQLRGGAGLERHWWDIEAPRGRAGATKTWGWREGLLGLELEGLGKKASNPFSPPASSPNPELLPAPPIGSLGMQCTEATLDWGGGQGVGHGREGYSGSGDCRQGMSGSIISSHGASLCLPALPLNMFLSATL